MYKFDFNPNSNPNSNAPNSNTCLGTLPNRIRTIRSGTLTEPFLILLLLLPFLRNISRHLYRRC